jgi:hypothetical protein
LALDAERLLDLLPIESEADHERCVLDALEPAMGSSEVEVEVFVFVVHALGNVDRQLADRRLPFSPGNR